MMSSVLLGISLFVVVVVVVIVVVVIIVVVVNVHPHMYTTKVCYTQFMCNNLKIQNYHCITTAQYLLLDQS